MRHVRVTALGIKPIEVPDRNDPSAIFDEEVRHLDEAIENALYDRPDFIVLPEACDRPYLNFDQRKRYFEYRKNDMCDHIREIAAKNHTSFVYSAAISGDDGVFRNTSCFIDDKGEIRGNYHKNHLVIEENTVSGFYYGKDAPIVEMPFGKVGGVICFDLNFDELREKYVKSRPELLVFSSMYHGGFVQRNWAYTCRSWFVGSIAGNGCDSTIINPVGDIVAHSTNYFPYVTHDINLDYEVVHLDHNWGKLNELRKKYGRGVKIYDPGYLGAVLITSECDTDIHEMIREFGIELIDDYFGRSLADRHTPGKIEP